MTLRASSYSLVVLAALSSGCAKTGSPAAPSPDTLPALNLACPAPVVTQSVRGEPVTATYEAPVQDPAIGAQLSCSPISGTAFPVGTNTVTCESTNTKQSSSCEFIVFVKAPPKLRKTRFVAFGDSITDGFLRVAPEFFGPAGDPISYPFRLQALLDARYLTQSTLVINEGLGGETAAGGAARLPRVLDQTHPDVLLLLEGINQLWNTSPQTVKASLRTMVRAAKGRGAEVLIATLTPVTQTFNAVHPGVNDEIDELNSEIFDLAREENLGGPVDIFTAFGDNRDLIGGDGEHPSEAGYQVMAQTFFDRIRDQFEIVQTPSAAAVQTSALLTPPR